MNTAFAAAVDETLADLADEIAARHDHPSLAHPRQGLGHLSQAIRQAITGGKHLRSALLHAAWTSVTDDGEPPVGEHGLLGLALAIELFHCSALVHDDLIDRSPTRRGHPSSHVAFATLHQANGWEGEGEALGWGLALLVGDLLLVEAERAAHTALATLTPRVRETLLGGLDSMKAEVIAGQFLDTLGVCLPVTDPAREEEDAWRMLRAKSARYSVGRPLTLGAMAGGAGRDTITLIGEAGEAAGEAFQLRDDLLGVFGDPALTGKPVGSDLVEAKRTVLVARARSALTSSDLARFDLLFHNGASPEEVAEMTALIARSGACEQVEALIGQRHGAALAALDRAALPAPQALVALISSAANRTS
jgi:geranylgeranyl diphosphate synthase type I